MMDKAEVQLGVGRSIHTLTNYTNRNTLVMFDKIFIM